MLVYIFGSQVYRREGIINTLWSSVWVKQSWNCYFQAFVVTLCLFVVCTQVVPHLLNPLTMKATLAVLLPLICLNTVNISAKLTTPIDSTISYSFYKWQTCKTTDLLLRQCYAPRGDSQCLRNYAGHGPTRFIFNLPNLYGGDVQDQYGLHSCSLDFC